MFVLLAAKSLFIFFFLRLLVVGDNFGTSVNASSILTATRPILNSLATLATIPTSCNNTCNDISALISDCTTIQCACTSSNTAAIDTCANCLEAVDPNNQTVAAMAQNILNQYVELCDGGGVSVPIQTASGFTGSVFVPTSIASSPAGQSTPSETETGGEPPQSSQSTTGLLTSQGVPASSTSIQTSAIPESTTVVTVASSAASSTASSAASSTASSAASSTASSSSTLSSSAAPSTTTVGSNGGNRMFGDPLGSGMLAMSLLFGILVSWTL